MVKVNYSKDKPQYFNVLASDGTFRKVVDQSTEGAVRRDWKTEDGKSGTKWELKADSIEGVISRLGIYEGEYGKNILIALGDADDEVVISLSSSSNFGEDFMKKLPNIDITKSVKLSPYSFADEKTGKTKRGISIVQDDVKIESAYSEKNEKTGKWKVTNGMPDTDGDTAKFDSDDWRAHFIKVRKFLLGKLEKHELFTEDFQTTDVVPVEEGEAEMPEKKIKW